MKHDEKTTLLIEMSMKEAKEIKETMSRISFAKNDDVKAFLKLYKILSDFYEGYGLQDYKEEE